VGRPPPIHISGYATVTRCKFSRGSGIRQASCCSCAVASEQYYKTLLYSRLLQQFVAAVSTAVIVVIVIVACYLSCLHYVYNK